jgi:hypothetical protein
LWGVRPVPGVRKARQNALIDPPQKKGDSTPGLRPRACGGSGAGFGVQETGINPTGGAIPRRGGPLGHRAGERGFYRYFLLSW